MGSKVFTYPPNDEEPFWLIVVFREKTFFNRKDETLSPTDRSTCPEFIYTEPAEGITDPP